MNNTKTESVFIIHNYILSLIFKNFVNFKITQLRLAKPNGLANQKLCYFLQSVIIPLLDVCFLGYTTCLPVCLSVVRSVYKIMVRLRSFDAIVWKLCRYIDHVLKCKTKFSAVYFTPCASRFICPWVLEILLNWLFLLKPWWGVLSHKVWQALLNPFPNKPWF